MKQKRDVAAALIREPGNGPFHFLICRRPPHKARGGLYEFVGGKTEPGETPEQALIRECREELGVEVSVGDLFMEVLHDYPDITIRLLLYWTEITRGEPQLLEHTDIRYITPAEIPQYAFCPADKVILKRLSEEDLS